ncbi:hypothetical protein BJF86_07510 [Serinicoccus sp. CNJ-927]|uniref:hypothetical protein n=1 Tax=Serinicoccus sp. CNJ-927 TaxID=1904970 RepID=UPI00095A8511|nr:hypothetical protein [Serinicoccus sp. CNJ-927]OLT17288.1 hypothetical protein BJF80_03830 [Serinicoccus sp. CUA-874]OLT39685.1 hypothetical protein BJF86_07510 [Serinicoccus sp. CNJ-927]
MTAADETYLDLALSRSRVDRWASVRTDDPELAAMLGRPATRVLELRGATAPVERDPARLRLRAPEPEDPGREPGSSGGTRGSTTSR